ncbi:MAG: hypothetical protein IJX89_04825 [Alphaproteobacteria bacterium]|nr:hypothetical protein [Alphaproteobacteria bacterium]
MNEEAKNKTLLEIAQAITESRKNRPTHEEIYTAVFSAFLNLKSVLQDLEKIINRESNYRVYDKIYHERRQEFDKII